MAYDDTKGGIDRAHYASTTGIWGDAWGDRSIPCLWDSLDTNRQRAELDRRASLAYQERQARVIARNEADAKRRRSAPVEAKIRADQLKNAKTSMGAAFRDAYARQNSKKALE